MKAAVILPQKFLHLTKDDDYHMVLAHLVGKAGFEDYTEFYRTVGHDSSKFLIMDTGLIEGDARPTSELIEKAQMLSADEMILNDAYMDKDATLMTSYRALEEVKASGLTIRTMAVPQGATLDEWIDCAREMADWGVDTLGIPKVISSFAGDLGRLEALMCIRDYMRADQAIHLLGCWESPLELKVIAHAAKVGSIAPVRGVDTAIAYAYARAGIRISEDERPAGEIDFAAQVCDLELLQYNIAMYKSEASGFDHGPRII